jgi:hypothetical protein
MSNPTTPFGWQMPTATDLVTDLPADFEVFGQAVATSMADLLGGTTGQVLAKNSNTDMDFVWTTANPGDITAVTAGTGITGGGTSGAVTVSFDQANFGGGQFAAGKNKIINGDFGVWQRGTSFSITNTIAYTADRFMVQCNSASLAATISQETFTPGTAPVAGYEGQFFLRVTNPAGATNTEIQQRVEDVRTFAGQTVTLSFWAKASSAVTMANTIIQNFGSGGSGTVSTTGTSQTLTTSWARYSTTINVPSVSGKTIGTSSYLQVYPMYYSSGTIASNVIDIWGVQVESGSTATPFQTATGTLQGELAACQRYYYRTTNMSDFTVASVVSTTIAQGMVYHPVTMRTAPTLFDVSNVFYYDSTAGSQFNTGTATSPTATVNGGYIRYTHPSGALTQGRAGLMYTTGYYGFGAEL